jgi:hypothetical protein
VSKDQKGRLCKCGCQAVLLPQDSRDHASLECAERSRQRATKSTGLTLSAVGGGVWDMLPPLAPVIEFPKAWIAKAVAKEDEDSLCDEPVEVPLRPAASVAQVRWARDMIAQFPRKSREQIQRENSISWAQLEHFAKTPLSGLPERATKRAKDQAKAAAVKEAAKPAAKLKSSKKAKGV